MTGVAQLLSPLESWKGFQGRQCANEVQRGETNVRLLSVEGGA